MDEAEKNPALLVRSEQPRKVCTGTPYGNRRSARENANQSLVGA
jgi:hypothetical protein